METWTSLACLDMEGPPVEKGCEVERKVPVYWERDVTLRLELRQIVSLFFPSFHHLDQHLLCIAVSAARKSLYVSRLHLPSFFQVAPTHLSGSRHPLPNSHSAAKTALSTQLIGLVVLGWLGRKPCAAPFVYFTSAHQRHKRTSARLRLASSQSENEQIYGE
ncbi:hypothetical protein DL95DRAFT_173329 [Leptodontidium sp. 2 PMI_412]|nr:hypothetical protein DL95DRAFT_173329 [Leptodontidium sp. 2 PMI_412]